MLKTLKKNIHKVRFPYIYTHTNLPNGINNVKFHINNSVEKFRLQHFGNEQDYTLSMIKDLKKDDIFYDIGASVGAVSVTAGLKATQGQIISFEPDPGNLDCLKKNFQLNNLSNFSIQPIALGNKEGEMELFSQGSNGFSPSLRQVNGIETAFKVPVKTIDNLLKNKEIPFPDVIKIDVEGAEMMVLEGMSELLSSAKKPRIIFVELHPKFLSAFDTSLTAIFKFILSKDYAFDEFIQRHEEILCKLTIE